MQPAGSCFTDVTFFFLNLAPLDNVWTDRNVDCCINIVDEKNYYGYKFGKLWFSNL